MIKTFKNKALRAFFLKGKVSKINPNWIKRIGSLLDQLDAAALPEDMNIPGNDFHGLEGNPKRYSVHVNGNWCITYEWDGEDAVRVNLEGHH